MKQRPIFVNEDDYQTIGNDITKSGKKWWSETDAKFFIHKRTATFMVFCFIGVILVVAVIAVLNGGA